MVCWLPTSRAADAPPAVVPADVPARPRARPPRSRRSWWFLGGAVAAFGAALVLAVSLFSTDRLPGQSATGSISLSQSQQVEETLAQAATDQDEGQAVQAAQLYQSVLATHPDNEVALAQLGWLEYETGRPSNDGALISAGRTKLNRAVKLAPDDYAARLYLGTVLLQQDDNATGAVTQYRMFLADGPPTALVEQATPVITAAYQKAGLSDSAGIGRRLTSFRGGRPGTDQGWIQGDAGQPSAAAISEKAVAPSMDSRTMSAWPA